MLLWKCENNFLDGKCEIKKKIEICCDLKYICGVLYLGYVNLDVLYLVNEIDDLLIVVFGFK